MNILLANTFVVVLLFRLAVVCVFFFLGWALEAAFAADKNDASTRGVLFNCGCTVIFQALTVAYALSFAGIVSAFVAKAPFHGFVSAAIVRTGFLPVALSIGCGTALLSDFFYYWLHRLEHASPWLWAEHELHHSDEHLNVTTTFRAHWLQIPLQMLFIATPLQLLFGLTPMTLAAAIVAFQAPTFFIHLNSRIRFGALGRIFACPQTHRIHHSIEPRHFDKNFATMFTLWDSLFGTYYHPAKDEWPETGVAGRAVSSVPHAMVMPFLTWATMLKERWNGTRHRSITHARRWLVETAPLVLGRRLVIAMPHAAEVLPPTIAEEKAVLPTAETTS